MAQIILPTGTAPATPAAGTVTVYSKASDKKLYYKDDTGAEAGPLGSSTFTGGNLTSGLNEARGSIAMHATTMDLWAQPNIIDGTSTAVTITAIANAPQAGARRTLYPVAGSIITNGATFAVDGAANATAAAGDKWEFEAITTSTYKVHITKKDGTAVATSMSTSRLIGRTTAGTGAQEEITVGSGLSLSGGSLTATGSGITLGTPVASTSGTSIDFTGIPSTAKRITINFKGVSTSGTSHPLFQIGDSGGIETTGYLGSGSDITTVTTYTTGFGIPSSQAANVLHGSIVLSLMNSANNTWAAHGIFGQTTNNNVNQTAGVKSTSATLDRVRITTVGGSDTFDAGEINISYE